jgi:hypothetical protein
MPAVSKKQQRFMALCAHHPEKAKGKCPPKKVAHDFSRTKPGFINKRRRRD